MEVPPPSNEHADNKESGVGPFVGIVIIVGLLLAGGIYFFITWQTAHEVAPDANDSQEQMSLDATAQAQADLQ